MTAGSSSLHGCLVVTKQGRTLLACTVGAYAQQPALKPASLGALLATMQDLSGSPPDAFLELGGVGIALLEAERVIVGVLCDPAHEMCARLVGRQVLCAFLARFGRLLPEMEAEHAREITAMLSSYTFASATKESDGAGAARTLPPLASFQRESVQPLLLGPPLTAALLRPLLSAHAGAIRAYLLELGPALEPEQPAPPPPPPPPPPAAPGAPTPVIGSVAGLATVLLEVEPRAGGGLLSAWAGPHLPSVWAALSAHVGRRCAAGGATAAEPVCETLALADCVEGGTGHCLHVAALPVALPDAAACVVLFYGAECSCEAGSTAPPVGLVGESSTPAPVCAALRVVAAEVRRCLGAGRAEPPPAGVPRATVAAEEAGALPPSLPPSTPIKGASRAARPRPVPPGAPTPEVPATPFELIVESPRVEPVGAQVKTVNVAAMGRAPRALLPTMMTAGEHR